MIILRSPTMPVSYAVYSAATGAIRFHGRCTVQELAAQDVRAGEALIEGDLPFDTAYVDLSGASPMGRPRPSFPAFDKLTIKADGQDAAAMVLPIAAVVTLDGVAHEVPAGPLRIPADTPGQYSVEITAWPYLPARVIVEAA